MSALSEERNNYIDVLRTAACLFVVLLHCISGFLNIPGLYGSRSWELFNALNSVCRAGVPLFFMISGYLTLRGKWAENFRTFYKSKMKRLLLPMAAWNVIYYLYYGIVRKKEMSFSGFFAALVNEGSAYHLWFLYTLLVLWLLSPFLKIITDKLSDKQLFGLFILAVFPSSIRPFINLLTGAYIYLFDSVIGGYVGYFILGLILGRHEFSAKERTAVYVVGMFGVLICIFGNRVHSSAEEINLVFNSGYSINNYLVSAAIFVFAKNRLNGKHMKRLSDCTFGVYLMHVMVLDIVGWLIHVKTNPTVIAGIYFICTSAVSFGIMLCLNKIRSERSIKRGLL